MRRKILKNVEWWILICAIILSIIGCVALFSATQETNYSEFKKQIIWLVVSIVIMLIVMFIDYEILVKISPIFYGIFIILLIVVLFTEPINGARSWIGFDDFSLQPGELAKVFVVVFLAYIISKFQERGINEINKPWKLLVCISIVAVPVFLIILEPDYRNSYGIYICFNMCTFCSWLRQKIYNINSFNFSN